MIDVNKYKGELKEILLSLDSETEILKSELIKRKKPINQFEKGENLPGVYAFFISKKENTDLKKFKNIWNDKSIIKYPKIVASRFKDSEPFTNDLYAFYVGKSEKVATRIHEHLHHKRNVTTYGLKINERKNLLDQYELFYAIYEFDDLKNQDKSIIQFIITRLESKLRDKMKPWVGKQ